jgi:CRP/FNR family transcriptional regulator, cyclic AMP receptor protein
MYLAQQTPDEFKRLDARAKAVLADLLQNVPPVKAKARISSNQDVFTSADRKGKLYLIKDGILSYVVQGKALFYFEPGDLIGTEHFLTGGQAQILSDFAVVVDEYDGTEFLKVVCNSPELHRKWSEYLVLQSSLMVTLTGSLIKAAPATAPDIQTFMPGEIICAEGTTADNVFALVEGEAEAQSGNNPVGRIQAGEMFGVLAAVTEIPRTATVVAVSDCLVMILPRESFLHVIESKPSTVLKMIQEMGQTLINVNEKALSLSFSKF